MKNKNILSSVFLIYVICFILRLIEYFLLRTDSTVIGEALFHKLVGIAILIIFARAYKYRAEEVGFSPDKGGIKLVAGLLFGIVCFASSLLFLFKEKGHSEFCYASIVICF